MKKLILCTTLLIAMSCTTRAVSANSIPYEPVFEATPITESMTTATSIQPAESSMIKIASTEATAPVTDTAENANLQSAMMQLDSAQVEYRNQLIQYKSEYADIDNSYKMIKEQRAAKAKLVKQTEKKIKSLEATKERIRKNMN